MPGPFDYFVIFAEMRTGSNFLESSLNDVPGITCHGEVFNPHFLGHADQLELFGTTIQVRESDPLALIGLLRQNTDGLAGFRFFHDHDPRVSQECLSDHRCAKIILTRNPLDTYVSREIVRRTGQWRLNDLKHAKSAQIRFDADEFKTHLANRQSFQQTLQHMLQTTGQTAFYLGYDDITDVRVLNGLIRFLGVSNQLKSVSNKTKKQNPRTLQDSVENFLEMERALTGIDYFDLNSTSNFEPRRGPNIPKYVAAAHSPLLFMPIPSSATQRVNKWLADLDTVEQDELMRGFTQKTLRHWKRHSRGHRSFTVIRHPVARLHDAFTRHILMHGPDQFTEIHDTLRKIYKLPFPNGAPDKKYDLDTHRQAFIAFADFVRGNLGGQTSIRVDGSWSSQCEIISGMGQFTLPDRIFRENELQPGLNDLADHVGKPSPDLIDDPAVGPFSLADIYNKSVESAVKAAYQRDYMMFGYGPWA